MEPERQLIDQTQPLHDNSDSLSNKSIEEKPQEQIEHKTLNHNSLYYNFIQRYFTTYQFPQQYLYRHSNGLYLVGVRLTQNYQTKPMRIIDVLQVQEVRGKKKRGGVKVHRNTHLCDIQMEDQTVLRVHCLVEGAIIERNHNLTIDKIGKPEGYIVVIMPKKRYKPDMKESVQLSLPVDNF